MFKKPLRNAAAILALAGLAMSTSCLKDDLSTLSGDGWSPEFAVPLINDDLGIYDLTGKDSGSVFVVDPDTRLLALIYKGAPYTYNASQLIRLPDQKQDHEFALSAAQIAQFEAKKTHHQRDALNLDFNPEKGEQIDSIVFSGGQLVVNINSRFRHNGVLTLEVPGFKRNGTSLKTSILINYTGTVPVVASATIDLAGYHADLTNGIKAYNKVYMIYDFDLTHSGNATSVSEKASAEMQLVDLQFEKIYGDFRQRLFDLDNDSIQLQLFNSVTDGYFKLVDPKFKVNISNSFGLPIDVNIKKIESINKRTGKITKILLNNFQNPFPINYPDLSRVGDSVATYKEINSSNSTISELIVPTPKYLHYQAEGITNPTGVPNRTNFVTAQSRIHVTSELEMPLVGFAYDFKLVDTVKFEINEALDNVESLLIRVAIENGFPIDMRMQMHFTDQNYKVLDSLTNNELLAVSGILNNSGDVVARSKKISDYNFTRERLPNLRNAKYVIISGIAETHNGRQEEVVRIYEYYKIGVKLGIKAKVLVSGLLDE